MLVLGPVVHGRDAGSPGAENAGPRLGSKRLELVAGSWNPEFVGGEGVESL